MSKEGLSWQYLHEQPGQGKKIGDWINHDEEHDDIVTRSTATVQKA